MYKCLKKQSYEDSEGYQLVPVRPEDIEAIRVWRNDQIDVLRQTKVISPEEQVLYYQQFVWPLFGLERPRQILFSLLFDQKCIGYGGLTNIDWESWRGELSFLVDPVRAKNVPVYISDFRHFLSFIVQVAFNELKFNRLVAETFVFRQETIECLKDFGFKKEGRLRKHVFKRNQWVDSVLLGLLASDWRQTDQEPHSSSSVLITSISKKIPLIEAVRKASQELGAFQTIHGADSSALCIGQYAVDQFWHCPALKDLTIKEIIAYCQKHSVKAIIPTRDDDLEFYASNLSVLQEEGIQVAVSSSQTLAICLDKKKFADELIAAGFPAIPVYSSVEEFQASSYVVKEKRGAGSQKIGLNLSRKQAAEHGLHLENPIYQPFIQGEEWSVDVYRSFAGEVKGCVARQRNLVVNGESQITTTAHYPLLEELCKKMADKLNIHGSAVFQVIEKEKGSFQVIECNPRFGGASTAGVAAGMQTFLWFFAECLGKSLDDYPFKRTEGDIRQIRYPKDMVIPWTGI